MITLLQAGTAAYDTGFALSILTTSGAFILTIVIAVVGYLVQARLQSVFEKYSQVMFPGGLTGAEVAEKMLRDNNIHNVKITHVAGHLTDHFNPQTASIRAAALRRQPSPATSAAMPCSTHRDMPRCSSARNSYPSSASRRR